jgi:hypothetical protein
MILSQSRSFACNGVPKRELGNQKTKNIKEDFMKRGLIVYLTGGAELPEGFDLLSHCREMGFTTDRVELVGSKQGFFEVNDAWHHLFTRGFGDIQLLVAQAEHNGLQPLHPPVRLSG